MRAHATITCLVVANLVSGVCTANANRVSYKLGNKHAALSIQIPWQLTQASTASRAQGERTSVKYVRKLGRVQGTDVALAYASTKMTPYPGPHSIVQPCLHVILPQATRIGAYSVEAAAAGPERHLRHGAKRQQVFFRIFYRKKNSIEVRQAALMCKVNAGGTVIAADPV